MRMIKFLAFTLLMLLGGCIDAYNPKVKDSTPSVVIEGQLKNDGKTQSIKVSYSSNLKQAHFIPILGCKVSVSDNLGNTYIFEETNNGIYTFWFNPSDLSAFLKFRLQVILPDSTIYISDEEQVLNCPKVDSIYFTTKKPLTNNPAEDLPGIQILADYDGENTNNRFVKFDIEETWKYATPFVVEGVYDTSGIYFPPVELSRFHYCWKSDEVSESFFLSTEGLLTNRTKQFPLHFVSNLSNRLQYTYSVLVSQQSISESAYLYFNELKNTVVGDEGLHEKQPSSIRGNIYLKNDRTQAALGYFYVSQCTTKRIYIKNKFSFKTMGYAQCYLTPIFSFGDIPERLYPIYIQALEIPVEGASQGWASKSCFDCTLNGGSTTKPDFWDE